MARALKWSLAGIGACLLTALLVGTIIDSTISRPANTPEWARVRQLSWAVRRTALELGQLMRRDTLIAALPAANAIVLHTNPALDSLSLRRLRRDANAEFARYPDPRARIAVVVIDPAFGTPTDAYISQGVEYYTGVDASGPYCGATARASRAGSGLRFGFGHASENWTNWGEGARPANILGPCAFWARYGAPGEGTQQWLQQGAIHFAHAPADWLSADGVQPRRSGFARRFRETIPAATSCQAGRRDDCSRALTIATHPSLAPGPHAALSSNPSGVYQTFGPGDAALLAHIERDFGPDRFAQFWHSDADVERSFQSAFGVSLDQWLHDWVQKYFGTEPVGPGVDWGSGLLSLLTIAGLIYIAVRTTQVRTVA